MAKASSMEEQLNLARGLRRIPPCTQCRLRKVKCDKQRPCENCQKSGVDCIYNENHGGSSDVESQSELLERVALLEAQLQAVTASLRAKDVAPPVTTAVGVSADEASTLLECNCGRQILGTHFSVHYDYYLNWVELFPNLRDIYFEITAAYEDSDGPKEASPSILGPVQRDPFALQSYLPADAEADLLIEIFFQNVNPFVRILNKATFFADLTRFRAGQLAQSNSFVALLFSIYGLAVASLLPSDVVASFGVEREWLLYKYQEAQEIALHQVDFISSNKLSVFQAYLYYLTFLFARGNYQTATALVGLAARNAQRLGLHKDPSFFNYSQWVSEWRRRLWNQVILLDQKAIALQGAISILAFPWDTTLPASANDEAWNTSPSAKPSDTPTLTSAFSQMTFVLLKRAVLAVLCPLRQNLRTRSYTQQLRHIEAGHEKARALFANVKDDMKPLATFANSIMEIEFGLLRLMAGEGLIRFGEAPPSFKLEHFIGALTLLERVTALEKEAMNPGWMWVYRTEPPLLAIAIVLSHMTVVRDTPYDARAWSQISLVFDRYMNVAGSYSPPIIASLRKFYDLLKSLRTQTSLGLSPMHLSEEFLGQSQFNYFISGEEPNLGTLGVAYQEDDLFSLSQLSSDAVL